VIETLQYPADIGDEYGTTSHYMVLFVNELSNSAWLNKREGKISEESPEIERSRTSGGYHLRTQLVPMVKEGVTKVGSVVAAVKPGDTKENETKIKDSISEFFNQQAPSYKRTKAVIALPLPELINNTYAADWMAADTTSAVSNIASLLDKNSSAWKQAQKIAVNSIARTFLGEGAAASITKGIKNPKRELVFQGNLPRGFSFQWNLFARTPAEAKAIWDIIQMLKFHMLPEYDEDTAGMFVKFPSTFDIEFYSNGERNDWLYKTSTVALTNLDINYTPAGTTAFLKKPLLSDNDLKEFPQGSPPIGVSISTNFMELETLYKNRIDPTGNFRFNQTSSSSGGTF
nr:hypothetical protein [Coprothermobacter proteolyticus]